MFYSQGKPSLEKVLEVAEVTQCIPDSGAVGSSTLSFPSPLPGTTQGDVCARVHTCARPPSSPDPPRQGPCIRERLQWGKGWLSGVTRRDLPGPAQALGKSLSVPWGTPHVWQRARQDYASPSIRTQEERNVGCLGPPLQRVPHGRGPADVHPGKQCECKTPGTPSSPRAGDGHVIPGRRGGKCGGARGRRPSPASMAMAWPREEDTGDWSWGGGERGAGACYSIQP